MIERIKQWSGVIALVAIVLLLVLNATGGGKNYGAILDTSYFDFFNASSSGGFQINGTTFLSATTFSLPSGITSWTINGVTKNPNRSSSLTTATTTVCAIQSPAATSTLTVGAVRFTTSSTTATTITLAKAATAFATTTILAQTALAAGAQGTVVASSTSTGSGPLDPNIVFGPSQWLVVGMAGGTGTFSPVGSCVADWTQI